MLKIVSIRGKEERKNPYNTIWVAPNLQKQIVKYG